MNINLTTYTSGDDAIRRADARSKIVVMVVFSIAVLMVDCWVGIAVLCAGCALCARISRLRLTECMPQLTPFVVVACLLVLFNSFVIGNGSEISVRAIPPFPTWTDPFDPTMHALSLGGSVSLSLEGLLRGLFLSLRLALLVVASLVLTTTTSATQISQGLERALHPLTRFGIQTRDACTVLSIALRFIPETIDNVQDIKRAQQARGARFDTGDVSQRIAAWSTVFVPLFAEMFRKAERLATAMDARCYGKEGATYLNESSISVSHALATVAVCIVLIAVAVEL